jgi:DNA-binding transcriptional MerR regulator
MNGYSTRQAAAKLGISLSTLNKFIALGQIPEPPVTQVAGIRVRLWTDADIARVRQILPKIANGRKTRHKRKGKSQTKKKKSP